MEPVGHDAFLDRLDDRRALAEFLAKAGDGHPRVLVLRAPAASGVTHFLRGARQWLSKENVTVFADLRSDSLSSILGRYAEAHARVFAHLLCSIFRFRSLVPFLIRLSGFLLPVPYGRPGAVATEHLAGVFLNTPYHSAPLQHFAENVTCRLGKRPVVFLIDNAQAELHKVEELLRATYAPEYDHVRFVIAFVDRPGSSTDSHEFRQRILSTGHRVQVADFGAPDDQLVAAFGHAYQLELPYAERTSLLAQVGANIWRIRDYFSLESRAEPVSDAELYVLRLLRVAGQPIQFSDLRIIGNDSPLTVTVGERNWRDLIDRMARRNYVSVAGFDGGDSLVSIGITSHPGLEISDIDTLVYARELYDYFYAVSEQGTRRHAASAVHGLLYRLSKSVAVEDSARWARELLKAALEQGSVSDAERYIASAGLDQVSTRGDLLVEVAFYTSVLDYDRVFERLEATRSVWRGHRFFEIIHAVALNRTRAHDESFRALDQLLAGAPSPDETSLLLSYKIAGLIHDARFSEAARCARSAPDSIRGAHGYGYYLRNAAAAFMWGNDKDLPKARAMLNKAEKCFLDRRDTFGALTTRHNRACVDAYEGNGAKALETFEDLYKSIRVYGTQHIDEVGTNLGIARLLAGDSDRAAEHLTTICNIIEWDYPRGQAESALAFIEARKGDRQGALRRMRNALDHARRIGVDESERRCDTNAVLIQIITGDDPASWGPSIARLRACYGEKKRYAALEALCETPDVEHLQLAAFDYDFCQYWSQNPLAMIPDAPLA